MSSMNELEKLDLMELTARFKDDAPEGDEYAAAYYSDVAGSIVNKGAKGAAFLREYLSDADTARLGSIIFALSASDIEGAMSVEELIAYLKDERWEIVAESIDGLRRKNVKEVKGTILPLLKHSSPYVKGSVLRYVTGLFSEEALPLLIDSIQDASYIVRENAADEMGELGDTSAIPHLRSMLTDTHPHVRQAAQDAIEILEASEFDNDNSGL